MKLSDITIRTIALTTEATQRISGSESAPSVSLLACSVAIEPNGSLFDLSAQWAEIRERCRSWSRDDVRNHATVAPYYALYRQLGINPNKTPPSAANLLIRFAVGDNANRPVPRIHPAVDAGNVAQAENLVPVAIFDAEAVDGTMILDVARPGDTFLAFGFEHPEPVPPGRLVLRDESKVLSEFCYRDGKAQAVRPETRRLHIIACRVGDVPERLATATIMRVVDLLSACHHVR